MAKTNDEAVSARIGAQEREFGGPTWFMVFSSNASSLATNNGPVRIPALMQSRGSPDIGLGATALFKAASSFRRRVRDGCG